MNNYHNLFTVDLETTTFQDDCRMWGYGIANIGDNSFYYGNNLESFFDFFLEKPYNCTAYFHNLKFDMDFLLYWLFENGFEHVKEYKELTEYTFTTIIGDTNLFYSCSICFSINGKNRKILTFYDSYKMLPFSVDVIAKTFNLDTRKLKLDYEKYRPVNHDITIQEIEYIKHDVIIMAQALKILFDQNLTRWTQGGNALEDYKRTIGKTTFNKNFPPPWYDKDIRSSYKGGYVKVKDKIQEKEIEEGIVLDVNSLYPYVMYDKPLPFGEGVYFEGEYVKDKMFPLYIQIFSCQFELKKNKLPTICIKNSRRAHVNEYLENSLDEHGNEHDITLCLTSVDLDLFFKNYNVYNIQFYSGFKFMATSQMFKSYIDKWIKVKIEAEQTKNGAMRQLAKLMLNALYGKFATNPIFRSKYPYMDEDGMVRFSLSEEQHKKPLYLPVGTFITAWARYVTITSAQKVYDRFLYCDTDSLHLTGTELPKELEVDKYKLGAWKHELTFTRAKYLRQKCYIEEEELTEEEYHKRIREIQEDENVNVYEEYSNFYKKEGKFYELHITCAGMSSKCYKNVTFDNFEFESEFKGALKQKRVKGGIVLVDSPYVLRK